jgi:hypothetical protein
MRKFGKDYAQRIERSGLASIADEFARNLPGELIVRYGIQRGEVIYKGVKGKVGS